MIRKRLGSRLALLTGGSQDVPLRQQTLREILDWSNDLLNSVEVPGTRILITK